MSTKEELLTINGSLIELFLKRENSGDLLSLSFFLLIHGKDQIKISAKNIKDELKISRKRASEAITFLRGMDIIIVEDEKYIFNNQSALTSTQCCGILEEKKKNKEKEYLFKISQKENKKKRKPAPSKKEKTLSKKEKEISKLKLFSKKFLIIQKKKFPNIIKKISSKKIDTCARELDRLIRIDGYSFEQDIKPALAWVLDDEFWSDKVLSLSTLRKKSKQNDESKFTNLYVSYLRSTKEKQITKGKRTTKYDDLPSVRVNSRT